MSLSISKLSIAVLATVILLAVTAAAAPRASFTWSTTDAYKAHDVRAIGAERWLLELDACVSQADGHSIRSFRWTVTGGDDDDDTITTRTTTSCRLERAPQPPPIPATCLRPGAQDDPRCDPAPGHRAGAAASASGPSSAPLPGTSQDPGRVVASR